MLNGKGVGASSAMQCTNSPCLQPAAISQSVEASAISISATTIRPQMNAITCNTDTNTASAPCGTRCRSEPRAGWDTHTRFRLAPSQRAHMPVIFKWRRELDRGGWEVPQPRSPETPDPMPERYSAPSLARVGRGPYYTSQQSHQHFLFELS